MDRNIFMISLVEPETVRQLAEIAVSAFELAGVSLVVILSLVSGSAALVALVRRTPADEVYKKFRRGLTHSILVGLELLVIADIIATITVDLSMPGLMALGLLIFIRTFLSFSLATEIDGVWPWQRQQRGSRGDS